MNYVWAIETTRIYLLRQPEQGIRRDDNEQWEKD